MKPGLFTIDDILKATGGIIQSEGPKGVHGVAVDSRLVKPGDLFVALKGARVDGHSFVGKAFASGAHWALVEEGRSPELTSGRGGLVEVVDPWRALGDLAIYQRERYPVPVIGITGSIGKTSTKDLVASVLREGFEVLYNLGNQNSDIGLPLTLFRLNEQHEVAVLEMAMRGPGQIAYLTELARPQIGVITNIDSTHMELLGSIEAIANAKAELLDALPSGGTAVLNWDCPWVRKVADRGPKSVVTFGLESETDYRARDVESYGARGSRFLLITPHGEQRVSLPLPGRHMVLNALAAAAVGALLGLSLETIVRGLESASISEMRAQIHKVGQLLVLNDAYNAHPQSMLAALGLLGELEGDRKLAVLGSMLELGSDTRDAHVRVGRAVAEQEVDGLITVGDVAGVMAQAAVDHGLSREVVCECRDNDEAMRCLERWLRPRDAVLIKGSRGLGMEVIVDWLETGFGRSLSNGN